MRRRLTSILFLLVLGCFVVLVLPFDIVVSLNISMPETWRRLAVAERSGSSTKLQRETAARSVANPSLAASKAAEERPKATEANSADPKDKIGQGAALNIARVSPNGPSVFAGTAAPFAQVTVLDNTTAVASTTANANGDWSLVTEYKFADTDPKISVRAADPSAKSTLAAPAMLDSTSPPSTAAIADQAPPAVRLLKEFEGVVATAREEAKQRDAASSVKEGTADEPASTEPSAQALTAMGSPSNSSRPSLTSTPVPMTFVYNEATLTPEGRKAARLLLEYLTLKKFGSVTLSGHADERGLPDYNMELSRQRLISIERLLRDGGYQGKLDLLPKGATEPFKGVDRSRYPREELLQLDRRVELRVAN
jgi:outer membrane protein OmpA-like peptidoglycan-associated protein